MSENQLIHTVFPNAISLHMKREDLLHPIISGNKFRKLKYNLEEAKSIFATELNRFHDYFKSNPEATLMNPSLGLLSHKEWLVFHTKHFKHHFKQFSLLP